MQGQGERLGRIAAKHDGGAVDGHLLLAGGRRQHLVADDLLQFHGGFAEDGEQALGPCQGRQPAIQVAGQFVHAVGGAHRAADDRAHDAQDVAHPMLQFVQQRLQPRLGLFALGDVLDDAQNPPAMLRLLDAPPGRQPADAAVRKDHPPFDIQLARLPGRGEGLFIGLAVFRVDRQLIRCRRRPVCDRQTPELIDDGRPPGFVGVQAPFPDPDAGQLLGLDQAALAGAQNGPGPSQVAELRLGPAQLRLQAPDAFAGGQPRLGGPGGHWSARPVAPDLRHSRSNSVGRYLTPVLPPAKEAEQASRVSDGRTHADRPDRRLPQCLCG